MQSGLQGEIAAFRSEFGKEHVALRAGFKGGIAALRIGLKGDMAELGEGMAELHGRMNIGSALIVAAIAIPPIQGVIASS